MVSLGLEIFSWFLFFSTLSSTKDKYTSFSCCLLFFWSFLGLHPQHMEVPRLGVESELQLLAYTTAMATWDPSRVCNPHHSSQWCQIPNLLSEARDQIPILMDNRFVPAEPRQALLISLFLKPLALPCIFHAPRNYLKLELKFSSDGKNLREKDKAGSSLSPKFPAFTLFRGL